MESKAKQWQKIDSGERSFIDQARPAVIQAARARYHFALPYGEGKTVLDIGCGSGLGSAMLARAARTVVGLDYSTDSLISTRRSLQSTAVVFVAADAVQLPFHQNSFELITAFELIEHLHRPSEFLSEVKRLLEPSGTFILSTPNRPVYSPRGTWLDYHTREYDAAELRAMLTPYFPGLRLFGQKQLSKDAQFDLHPLNRVFYPIKRRLDPRGRFSNRLRAAYIYLRWGERGGSISIADFPVCSDGVESLPILIAVCGNR